MERPMTIEELLAHSGWLQGLAHRLVRDAGRADDLVQDTWMAALRRPPAAGTPARPWLARVLRNLRLNQVRGQHRRADTERQALGPRAAPVPEQLAHIADAQRLLAEEVARLDEPLRSVIVLRHYRGLDSNEIGRELGIPAGTARWRLNQAMLALRAALDRRSRGDRRAWLEALAPLAAPRVGFTVSSGTGAFLLATLATLAAVLVTTTWRDDAPAASDGSAVMPAVTTDGLVTTAEPAPDMAEREPAPFLRVSGVSTQVPQQARPPVEIRGSVRFVDGPATSVVRLELLDESARGVTASAGGNLRLGAKRRIALAPSGEFCFADLPADYRGELRVPGYVLANGASALPVTAPASDLVLLVRKLATISGTLLDERGRPLVGARGMLRCELEAGDPAMRDEPGDLELIVPLVTDDEGRFEYALEEIEGARHGVLWLQFELDQAYFGLERADFVPALGLELGERRACPVRPLEFRLHDPHGAPIEGALLRIAGGITLARASEPSSARGEARLDFAPWADFRLRVDALGFKTRVFEILEAAPQAELELLPDTGLVLDVVGSEPAPTELLFVLRSPDGLFPVPETSLTLEIQEQRIRSQLGLKAPMNHPESCLTGAEQVRVFRLRESTPLRLFGLRPGVPFTLETRAPDGRPLDVHSLELRAGETEFLEVLLGN